MLFDQLLELIIHHNFEEFCAVWIQC